MTVAAGPCAVEYRIDRASQNQRWPLPFAYMAPEHIAASLSAASGSGRTLRYGTEFTVSGQEVVTLTLLPVGSTLRLARTTPLEQPTLWVEGQAISTQAIMRACDRLTCMVQELAERVGRLEKSAL